MERTIEQLTKELEEGINKANNAREVAAILSTYNAIYVELLKVKIRQNKLLINDRKLNILEPECYDDYMDTLFSLFKSNEYIKGRDIQHFSEIIRLFLIDDNTILSLSCSPNMASYKDILYLKTRLLRINDCKAKVYEESVYCGDPYYCDSHFENKKAFGLFENKELIGPSIRYEQNFNNFDNRDIRDVLKVQSIDDIIDKMNESKDTMVRKLTK